MSQCFTWTSPELHLAVDEARVRSWAAATAQLQLDVTVLSAAAPTEPVPKKPGAAAAGGKGTTATSPPPAAPLASGVITVNCAGLLTGDSSAHFHWAQAVQSDRLLQQDAPPTAPTVPVQAAAAALPASSVGPATASLLQACPGPQHSMQFKWVSQPPSGTLGDWLQTAEVQVQVREASACRALIHQSIYKAL